MSGLTVMIVGSGAREHAISCAYEKSSQVERIIVTPGNDFIAFNREKEVIVDPACNLTLPQTIFQQAKKHNVDLVDVAQDDPIAAGTVDFLLSKGIDAFGPEKEPARIESDKKWARDFMERHEIPSPGFKYFDDNMEAKAYVRNLFDLKKDRVLYVKASGLCSGKGALKATSINEAVAAIDKMHDFGKAGKVFLVEEGLVGEEFSYYAVTDGENFKVFRSAQDNKTVFNFDQGDQTGGMGVVSPSLAAEPLKKDIHYHMLSKMISGMAKDGLAYTGIIYVGGIIVNGSPVNIEYNARWGDPECQAVLTGVQTDYVDIVRASLEQNIESITIEQDEKTRVCVVGASRGYPGDYSNVKGKRIFGLIEAMNMPGVKIFGAGIKFDSGKFYANGGRLFSVVGEGNDVAEARERAYAAISHISIEGNNLHYRTDIGWRDVERFRSKQA